MKKKSLDSKIISADKAQEYIQQGYNKADMHFHSYYSKDVIKVDCLNPKVLCKLALDRNLKYFSITDHDTMAAYDELGYIQGLIPGVEITILDKERIGHTAHVLVWNLNKKQFNDLEEIAQKAKNIHYLCQCLKDYNLPQNAIAHLPYAMYDEKPRLEALLYLAEKFDVLESSGSIIKQYVQLTEQIAKHYNKGLLMNTDSHIGQIGWSYTLAQGDTFDDFWQNIKKGNAYLVPRTLNRKVVQHDIMVWLAQFFDKNRIKLKNELAYPKIDVPFLDRTIRLFYHGSEKSVMRDILRHFCSVIAHVVPFASLYLKHEYQNWERINTEMAEKLHTIVSNQ